MVAPFERLLGDTAELRVLDFLLPVEHFRFSITEMVEWTHLSRKVVARVFRKFCKYKILMSHKGNHGFAEYHINVTSPFVKCIAAFNECLIETMVPKKDLKAVREYWAKRAAKYNG